MLDKFFGKKETVTRPTDRQPPSLKATDIKTIDDFLQLPFITIDEGHPGCGAYAIGKKDNEEIYVLFGSYLKMAFDEHFRNKNLLYVIPENNGEITDVTAHLEQAFRNGETFHSVKLNDHLANPYPPGVDIENRKYQSAGTFDVVVQIPADVLAKRDSKAYHEWASNVAKNIKRENVYKREINTASPGAKSLKNPESTEVQDVLFQTSNLKAEFEFLQDWKLEFKPYLDNSQEVGALIYARFTFNFVLSFEVIREWVNTGADFGVVVSHLRSKNYSLHWESVSKEAFGIFALFALRAPKEEPSDLRQPVDLSYVVVPLSKSFPHPLAKIKTDIPDLVGVDKPYSALHRYLRAHSVSICDETDILYYRPIFIDYGLDGEYRRYG